MHLAGERVVPAERQSTVQAFYDVGTRWGCVHKHVRVKEAFSPVSSIRIDRTHAIPGRLRHRSKTKQNRTGQPKADSPLEREKQPSNPLLTYRDVPIVQHLSSSPSPSGIVSTLTKVALVLAQFRDVGLDLPAATSDCAARRGQGKPATMPGKARPQKEGPASSLQRRTSSAIDISSLGGP